MGHCLMVSSILLRKRWAGEHTWATYSSFPRNVRRSLRVVVDEVLDFCDLVRGQGDSHGNIIELETQPYHYLGG